MRARMLNAMTAQASDKRAMSMAFLSMKSGIEPPVFLTALLEKRMLLTKELKEFYLKDGDHLTCQSTFIHVFDCLHTIDEDSFGNLKRDLFFLCLRYWNKFFVKTRLDEVFSTVVPLSTTWTMKLSRPSFPLALAPPRVIPAKLVPRNNASAIILAVTILSKRPPPGYKPNSGDKSKPKSSTSSATIEATAMAPFAI